MSNPSIAIIGLEGSGKTVLMTVLAKKLSTSPTAGGYMDPIGTQTMKRVESTWAALQRGEWPLSTSPGEMFNLTWKMYIQRDAQQVEADVRLIDIAGQDTRMLFGGDDFRSETREHLKPLVEYISNASVVLFVLNIKDYIAETDEERRIDNQVVLKSALDQLSGSKNILLVFAQYDQYEAFVNENGGLDAFCKEYLPYIYNSYISTEKKVFGTARIPMLCISAVNDTQIKINEDGIACRIPVPNFSSRGLEELCRWIVEKVSVLYEKSLPAGQRLVHTADGIQYAFRWCPSGTFMMGSPSSEYGHDSGEKQHQVTLTKGFWMLETQVTQAMWKSVMGNNPSDRAGSNLPVVCVNWNDCQEFCRKLSSKIRMKISLPTEAQWEYACRAGTTGPYAGEIHSMGWCGYLLFGSIHPVGQKNPNAWGLYDMHGNVFEWCQDWEGDYPYDSVINPTGPNSGSKRILRGGCWFDLAVDCRSAYRFSNTVDSRYGHQGFRVMAYSE